ncbi:MAG: TetR/AcrR family transcriptional regulator [Solirubrobacterales bacterium]|nr:TetR/AcrR family transcriptional regulator [Solirubrobacterales bacterium]
MSVRVKTYNSPLREQQARQTRERILQAARETFGARGYGATTLADIARAAEVAEPTVRAVFKTKPNLVEHLLRLAVRGEDNELQLHERDAFKRMLAASDADTLLERLADIAASLHSRSWDVMEIVAGAASSDPAIAELHEQRRRARHANQTQVARRLHKLGALPDGTTTEAAADLLWLYTAPENYRMLVIERGWSVMRYRDWFRSAVAGILT